MPTQTETLDRLGPGARVAVIRLRSLGDCILSTPAIHLLKLARPDLRIGVVVEDRFASVFENHPDIEEILPPGAQAIRMFSPVLCLNLHGGTRSARLTLLSGARFRAGFDTFRPGWIYNIPIPTAQEVLGISRRVHTAEHAAAAMFYLGVPITCVPRAQMEAPPGRPAAAPCGPYAVIHPLAATAEKTWPAACFLEIAAFLQESLGLKPVFIGGPGEDLSKFAGWHVVGGARLDELARLLRDASLFVGNDSGPAHMAAAFGVPQVVLFGPSDQTVWAPWQAPAEIIKAEGRLRSVPVARVKQAVESLWVHRVAVP